MKMEGFSYYHQSLDVIQRLADEKYATLAQISLAWMMNKYDCIVPIPGTRNEDRMLENTDASDIVLGREEVRKIDDSLNRLNLRTDRI